MNHHLHSRCSLTALGTALALLGSTPLAQASDTCRELTAQRAGHCAQLVVPEDGLLGFALSSSGQLSVPASRKDAVGFVEIKAGVNPNTAIAIVSSLKPLAGLQLNTHAGKLLLRTASSSLLLDPGYDVTALVVAGEGNEPQASFMVSPFMLFIAIMTTIAQDVIPPATTTAATEDSGDGEGGNDDSGDTGGDDSGDSGG